MTKQILCLVVLPAVLFVGAARGDELADLKARNAQLEATVEELTLQLAEALKERRRLEAALAAAEAAPAPAAVAAPAAAMASTSVSAPAVAAPAATTAPDEGMLSETEIKAQAGSPAAQAVVVARDAVEGCNVAEALSGYEGSGDDNQALSAWLKKSDHLKLCTEDQLRQIRKAVDWDFFGYQKEVLALIDRELSQR